MATSMLNGLNIGGLSHGSFFHVDDSIDTSKPPGVRTARSTNAAIPNKSPSSPHSLVSNSASELPDSLTETFRKIFIGQAFFYSPNLTWFIMAVCSYYLFPYDLETSNDPKLQDVLLERLWINNGLALIYIGFWHWVLYFYNICDRPFVPNRIYNTRKVVHNLFYTLLGIFQWTVVEGGFIYLYKNNKLPYRTMTMDGDRGESTVVAIVMIQILILGIATPAYRDIHFYFTHRLIHVRPFYKYIHSLHHRNTDVEPFSGLAMHPIEHMYYYTCYGPLLVLPTVFGLKLHPFLIFWMGMHAVITPAASHSGYEDHFSSDLHHYLHHRYCECNYSAGINFDVYFGTYRDTLKDYTTGLVTMKKDSKSSNGSSSEGYSIINRDCNSEKVERLAYPPPPADHKSSLIGCSPEYPEYQLGTYALIFGSIYAFQKGIITDPAVVVVIIPFGPAIWAFLLSAWSAPKSMSRRKICLAPFDKDSIPSLMLHLGLGIILGILPVNYLLYLILMR